MLDKVTNPPVVGAIDTIETSLYLFLALWLMSSVVLWAIRRLFAPVPKT